MSRHVDRRQDIARYGLLRGSLFILPLPSPTAVVTPTTLTSGANTWPATQVNVSYDHGYSFLRFVNFFGASFSVRRLDTVTLSAQATMRTEINTP